MRDFFNVFHYGPQNFLFSFKNLLQSIFSFGNNFLIRLYFLASQVMSKANLLDRTSLIIVFGSTQREGKLTGSSLIVAIVSSLYRLVFWKRQNACMAFHFNHLDICTVSILSRLLYESSCLLSARIRFRDWSVSRIVDHIKSKVNTRYSKHRVLRANVSMHQTNSGKSHKICFHSYFHILQPNIS